MLKFKNKWAHHKDIDFFAKRKIFFAIPIIIIICTILATIFMGINVDIKFKGGTIINCPYSGDINLDTVNSTAEDALGESVVVQTSESGEGNMLVITLSENKEITMDQMTALTTALTTAFPDNIVVQDQNEITVDTVSAQMGTEFFQKCLMALGVAFVALIIYIGIRFRKIGGISAGIMAILGLIHDVIIAFLIVVLCQFTIDDSFMAVLLTILGYSINNTIVIYDRIRENKGRVEPGTPIRTVVNRSINQTLSRSINTTFTTILALAVMLVMALIFHIDSIVAFVLPMMIGILAGAYSSICVSGPLWVMWKENHPDKPKRGKKETVQKMAQREDEQKEIEVRTKFDINPSAAEDVKDEN